MEIVRANTSKRLKNYFKSTENQAKTWFKSGDYATESFVAFLYQNEVEIRKHM